jgi:DNA invertase Pin-like site-specific DNA recombinase
MRCAIYTRKSSEEGLEQSFNSLDAQREAGEAFILSQRHEGWRTLPARYDDGGYSGGTMERPGLKQLLEDVQANKINVVVVYKVDRLTRSLSDFAKIVETLDAKGVSFVSVTQQFNTTTSMGRLTLNILLSFAQFEREVTGERIRDKIAASKKKGMWMGGTVPLGYDLEARKLIPHPTEAELVRNIFALYLKLGCVLKLLAQLKRENVKTKSWVTKKGIRLGGVVFAPGHLYYLLRNRLYVGEIRHRDRWYPGAHPGIVPRELWDKVQAQLDSNIRTQRKRAREQSSSLLTGLIEDGEGNRFTPSFTIKRGRRYRYYVSQAVIQNAAGEKSGPTRLPAHEIESRVTERLQAFLRSDAQVFDELSANAESPAVLHQLVAGAKKLAARLLSLPADDLRDVLVCILQRVIVQENNIQVMIKKSDLRELLEHGDQIIAASLVGLRKRTESPEILCLTIEAKRKRYGGEIHIVVPPSSSAPVRHPRTALIKAVARGHAWYEKVLEGKVTDMRSLARETGLTPHYVRNVFACAFLAPDIVDAILEGRQPLTLKFEHLYKNIPLSWAEQRQQFGFPQIRVQPSPFCNRSLIAEINSLIPPC